MGRLAAVLRVTPYTAAWVEFTACHPLSPPCLHGLFPAGTVYITQMLKSKKE